MLSENEIFCLNIKLEYRVGAGSFDEGWESIETVAHEYAHLLAANVTITNRIRKMKYGALQDTVQKFAGPFVVGSGKVDNIPYDEAEFVTNAIVCAAFEDWVPYEPTKLVVNLLNNVNGKYDSDFALTKLKTLMQGSEILSKGMQLRQLLLDI